MPGQVPKLDTQYATSFEIPVTTLIGGVAADANLYVTKIVNEWSVRLNFSNREPVYLADDGIFSADEDLGQWIEPSDMTGSVARFKIFPTANLALAFALDTPQVAGLREQT